MGNGWPIISDADAARLIALPKSVDEMWRAVLLNPRRTDGPFLKARIELPGEVTAGPVRGALFLYSRYRASEPEPRRTFTFGLGLADTAGRDYRLIRCNGPCHTHDNKVDREKLGAVCHVHRITERYQRHLASRPKWEGDGFAVATRPYAGPDDALTELANLANIKVEGALWA